MTALDFLKHVTENDSLSTIQKDEINLKDDVRNVLDAKITADEIVNQMKRTNTPNQVDQMDLCMKC